MSAYTSREDAYVAGRASAAVEMIQVREALHEALLREQDLLKDLRVTRLHLQKQQWVAMLTSWGCACLTLVCIFLWAQLSRPTF